MAGLKSSFSFLVLSRYILPRGQFFALPLQSGFSPVLVEGFSLANRCCLPVMSNKQHVCIDLNQRHVKLNVRFVRAALSLCWTVNGCFCANWFQGKSDLYYCNRAVLENLFHSLFFPGNLFQRVMQNKEENKQQLEFTRGILQSKQNT